MNEKGDMMRQGAIYKLAWLLLIGNGALFVTSMMALPIYDEMNGARGASLHLSEVLYLLDCVASVLLIRSYINVSIIIFFLTSCSMFIVYSRELYLSRQGNSISLLLILFLICFWDVVLIFLLRRKLMRKVG